MQENIPRSEYPRPDCYRKAKSWMPLNGKWDFQFDPENVGMKQEWFRNPAFNRKILVPFVYQSQLSGINDQSTIDHVWYNRKFKIPPSQIDKHILLHFGAVDYFCSVFLNEKLVGTHTGGSIPFTFDITSFLSENKLASQTLVVAVEDHAFDNQLPRGKQTIKDRMSSCDYERITGIWQSVWLEFVKEAYFDRSDFFIRTKDNSEVTTLIEVQCETQRNLVVECQIFDQKMPISSVNFTFVKQIGKTALDLKTDIILKIDHPEKIILWSPKTPKMYTAHFRLLDGDKDDDEPLDEIYCKFGFRTVEIRGNQILLNGEPIYLKFALYQGYWVEGLWTAPTDAAIKRDMELTLEMGWNGLRLHQKIEDPRLHYWADKLGILLWGEICNTGGSTLLAKEFLLHEWMVHVRRDLCHPSIIAWIPYNESWGVPHLDQPENQEFLKAIYHITKSLDPTRPVNSNDGWEQVNGATDLCSFHYYVQPDVFVKNIPEIFPESPGQSIREVKTGTRIFAANNEYQGEPVILSEWGGWGMNYYDPDAKPDPFTTWGYQGILYKTWDEILDLYGRTIDALVERKGWITGHVYTEFCDQYQEMNGMLNFDRTPKGDLKQLKVINDRL